MWKGYKVKWYVILANILISLSIFIPAGYAGKNNEASANKNKDNNKYYYQDKLFNTTFIFTPKEKGNHSRAVIFLRCNYDKVIKCLQTGFKY